MSSTARAGKAPRKHTASQTLRQVTEETTDCRSGHCDYQMPSGVHDGGCPLRQLAGWLAALSRHLALGGFVVRGRSEFCWCQDVRRRRKISCRCWRERESVSCCLALEVIWWAQLARSLAWCASIVARSLMFHCMPRDGPQTFSSKAVGFLRDGLGGSGACLWLLCGCCGA